MQAIALGGARMTTEPIQAQARVRRPRMASRAALVRLGVLALVLAVALVVAHRMLIVMPGESHKGPLPDATDEEQRLAESLIADVRFLAGELGPRNRDHPIAYERAAQYIEQRLRGMGYQTRRQPSPARDPTASPGNIIAERLAAAGEPSGVKVGRDDATSGGTPGILVIGAHYDSFADSPGANDNSTGVAAVLSLAEAFSERSMPQAPRRTVRFVLFADEEPPYFQTDEMGSRTYARSCRVAGDRIVGMLSLETIGWYSDEPGSQRYPPPLGALYPERGNFVAFVGNPASRHFLREVLAAFRETTAFPSEGAALPSILPGVSWSDHWAFWREGYPGLMITDTAPFRYPYYHTRADTPDKVDALRLARVVAGLERVLGRLAQVEPSDSKSP